MSRVLCWLGKHDWNTWKVSEDSYSMFTLSQCFRCGKNDKMRFGYRRVEDE